MELIFVLLLSFAPAIIFSIIYYFIKIWKCRKGRNKQDKYLQLDIIDFQIFKDPEGLQLMLKATLTHTKLNTKTSAHWLIIPKEMTSKFFNDKFFSAFAMDEHAFIVNFAIHSNRKLVAMVLEEERRLLCQ